MTTTKHRITVNKGGRRQFIPCRPIDFFGTFDEALLEAQRLSAILYGKFEVEISKSLQVCFVGGKAGNRLAAIVEHIALPQQVRQEMYT